MGPAILGIIGAVIMGVLQFVGGHMSNRTNTQNVENTNATNQAINEAQMAHEDEAAAEADQRTRNLFNDIESPAAKRRQLMDAGLSVGLMYGQGGNGGSLTQGAQAQSAPLLPAMAAQIGNIFDVSAAPAMAQAAKTYAETKNIEADTANKQKDLPLKEQMLENLKSQLLVNRQEITESMQRVENLFVEKLNKYKEGKNLEAQNDVMKAQKEYQESMNELTKINIKSQADINEANLKLIKAKTAEAYAAARKAGAEATTIETMRQQQLKLLIAQAQIAAFEALELKPAELKMFEANVQKIMQENASEKAMADIYGGWKGKARADAAMSWLNSIANIVRAGASVATAGAAIK